MENLSKDLFDLLYLSLCRTLNQNQFVPISFYRVTLHYEIQLKTKIIFVNSLRKNSRFEKRHENHVKSLMLEI
jgi:hypothetical protein